MKTKMVILLLLGCTFLSIGLVTGLFLLSEEKMQRNNAFQRRYLPHPVKKMGEYTLPSDSYYIVGFEDATIYLGNYNAPLYLMGIDTSLTNIHNFKVEIDNLDLPYRRVRIAVHPPYFYVGDGTVPILFRGNVKVWVATTYTHNEVYFSEFVVVDSSRIGIVTMSSETRAKALGLLHLNTDLKTEIQLNTSIPIPQTGKAFETDGLLQWNTKYSQFIYIYYYRNQWEKLNDHIVHLLTAKTIDTISQAIVDVAHYQKEDKYKMGSSTVLVNRLSTTDGAYLFVNSNRLGKYEEEAILKSASIIDVYDIRDGTYFFSFYLYHERGKKLSEFRIHRNLLIAIVEEKLLIYQLKPVFFKNGFN